jgi:hypothetical protein
MRHRLSGVNEQTSKQKNKDCASPIEHQIGEAKMKAEFSQTLEEAHRKEALSVKTLEREPQQWTKDHQYTAAEQLERELDDALNNSMFMTGGNTDAEKDYFEQGAKFGYNVAKYVPYGPIESVMPYLFRRADENSSIAGQTSREFTLLQKEVRRRKTA